MKRMTVRGDHGIYMAPGWDFRIDSDDYELVQKVLDRFAAYEDTGLAPEDITKPFGEEIILKLAASVFGIAPDRLRELARADQDGRCVVLPCKVGDTVYRVVTPTPGPPLLSEMKITTMKQAASLVNLVGKHKLVSYYLTREDAEAAVAKIATATEEVENEP